MKKYLAFVFLVSLLSCKSSTESARTASSSIMPLALDNEWDYQDSLFFSFRHNYFTDTVKIVAKYITDSSVIFLDRSSYAYEIRSDGLWTKDSLFSSIWGLAAKYPAQPGEVLASDSAIREVVDSINAVITVPAGTFTCYKYKSDNFDNKQVLQNRVNEYYAVGIGNVKTEVFIRDTVTQQLKLFFSRQLSKFKLH